MNVRLDQAAGGPENMALDLELLDRAESGLPSARIYCWDGMWVTIGNSQDIVETLCDPQKTRWVRRPTGGMAVLHGHDITVAIALPAKVLKRSPSTYRLVTAPLVYALRDCCIMASLAEDMAIESVDRAQPDCFAGTSRNDIVVNGRKICGCALRRTRQGVLLQASIPVAAPLAPPATIVRGGVLSGFIMLRADRLAQALSDRVQTVIDGATFEELDSYSV